MFWDLYKSERKFKDYQEGEVTHDPRFAYFQTCKAEYMRPKAGYII